MNRRRLITAAAVVGLALAVGLVTPAGAQFVSQYLGRTFTSTAPSGAAGVQLQNTGARVCLNQGCTSYVSSSGASQTTIAGTLTTTSGLTVNGATITFLAGSTISTAGAMRMSQGGAIPTCAAAHEGRIERLTGTGGTNTGSQTRFCVCVSDGAASPVYSWRNLISGTAGTATTCNP